MVTLVLAKARTYDGRGGVIDGTVNAGEGNDILRGGGKSDILDGGTGNDRLTGGGQSDAFVFSTGSGGDRITDFNAKGAFHDVVDLSEMAGVDSFDDLASHMTQQGKNALLDFGGGDVLTLKDVDVSDLTITEFMF
jgi:Ca2+-binding RTX toxin-like protein